MADSDEQIRLASARDRARRLMSVAEANRNRTLCPI